MKKLSVIVITRNRLEQFKRAIESLFKYLPESKIIIINNASTDHTREYLEDLSKFPYDCKVIHLNNNVGVAKARNIGISMVENDYIMFLDDDAWIGEINFDLIINYFDRHPEVGLISPRILYPNGDLQESARAFPKPLALLWRGSGIYKILPKVSFYRKYVETDFNSIHEIDWGIGACQIIRREAILKVGVLDEKYYFGYEDAEFCSRLKKNGYSIIYWPDAKIYHEYSRKSAKIINLQFIHHFLSATRFLLTVKK